LSSWSPSRGVPSGPCSTELPGHAPPPLRSRSRATALRATQAARMPGLCSHPQPALSTLARLSVGGRRFPAAWSEPRFAHAAVFSGSLTRAISAAPPFPTRCAVGARRLYRRHPETARRSGSRPSGVWPPVWGNGVGGRCHSGHACRRRCRIDARELRKCIVAWCADPDQPLAAAESETLVQKFTLPISVSSIPKSEHSGCH
jgi:hypothetical protein